MRKFESCIGHMAHNEHSISLTVEAKEAVAHKVAYTVGEGLRVHIEGDIRFTIKQWDERNFGRPVTVINLDAEMLRAISEALDNTAAEKLHTVKVSTHEGTFEHNGAEAVSEGDMLLIKDSKGNTVASYRYWDYWAIAD